MAQEGCCPAQGEGLYYWYTENLPFIRSHSSSSLLSCLSCLSHPNQSETTDCVLNPYSSSCPGVGPCLRCPLWTKKGPALNRIGLLSLHNTQSPPLRHLPLPLLLPPPFPRFHFRSTSLYCVLLAPLKIASTRNRLDLVLSLSLLL